MTEVACSIWTDKKTLYKVLHQHFMKKKYSYMAVHSLVVFGNRRWRGPTKMYLNILLNANVSRRKLFLYLW